MNRIAAIIATVALSATVVLAGCTATGSTGSAPASKASSGSAPASEATGKLSFATLGAGTSYYQVTVAQTTILNKYTKLETTPQPLPNANAQFDLVANGEVQVGLSPSNKTYEAYVGTPKSQGVGIFEGKPHPWIRVLLAGNRLYYAWITRSDTGIKTGADLKGKKLVGNVPSMLPATLTGQAELRAFGIDPQKDVTLLSADSTPVGLDKVADKSADAAISSVGGSKLQEFNAAVGGLVIVPFPADKISFVSKAVPGESAVTIPGTIPGVGKDVPGVADINELIVHKDMDDNTAYNIVKTLMEHEAEMAGMGPEASEWIKKNAILFPEGAAVPYHPGAVKYFKEIGIWTSDMDAIQSKLLKQ